jgi:hypothetical protein
MSRQRRGDLARSFPDFESMASPLIDSGLIVRLELLAGAEDDEIWLAGLKIIDPTDESVISFLGGAPTADAALRRVLHDFDERLQQERQMGRRSVVASFVEHRTRKHQQEEQQHE